MIYLIAGRTSVNMVSKFIVGIARTPMTQAGDDRMQMRGMFHHPVSRAATAEVVPYAGFGRIGPLDT
jgi:hypothetical protein